MFIARAVRAVRIVVDDGDISGRCAGRARPGGLDVSSSKSRSPCLAKCLFESRVVAYRGEVVVSACVVAEPREQLDGSSEVGERVVAGVTCERCEARVVVVQARVIWHVREA